MMLQRSVPLYRLYLLHRPLLLMGFSLLAVAVLACGGEVARPNVILISIDTLRADSLGSYGATSGASPQLDSFLSQSVVFRRAYTPEPHTLPAHTSLFTSLHPASHGVAGLLEGGFSLPEGLPTLASTLKGAGYTTAAFINGGFMHPRFGLTRGFDEYDYFSDIDKASPKGALGRTAAETNDAVFAWLDRHPSDDLFLFVHYFDVHSDNGPLPYDSPKRYRADIAIDPSWAELGGSGYLMDLNRRGEPLEPSELARLRSLYHAGLRYTDDRFGELVAGLKARDLYDSSLIILVADHGEEFQEHGRLLHTQLYEESLQIPMGLRFPDSSRIAPRTLESPVGLGDVMPTVLRFLGIELPKGLQGRSLLPLVLEGEVWDARPLFFIADQGGRLAMQVADWKMIFDPQSETAEFYDRVDDSSETTDLARERAAESSAAIERLKSWYTSLPKHHLEAPPSVVTLDEETIEQLRSLGYGGGESR